MTDAVLPKRPRGRPKKVVSLGSLTIDERIRRYTPYLREIQSKLFSILIVFSAVAIIGFLRYQKILGAVMHLFDLKGINIVMTSPYQFWSLAVNTGIVMGFVAAFPLILYQLISFLRPALKPNEYKMITRLIPASIVLFVIGFGFGVWIIQFVIGIYTQASADFSVGNLWDIGHFFSQILLMGLILALIFQLPIVMTALMRLNLVKHQIFITYRKFFYAAILIIAAVLPPTDIISLTLLTIPPLFLFELALVLNHPMRQARKPGIDQGTGSDTLE